MFFFRILCLHLCFVFVYFGFVFLYFHSVAEMSFNTTLTCEVLLWGILWSWGWFDANCILLSSYICIYEPLTKLFLFICYLKKTFPDQFKKGNILPIPIHSTPLLLWVNKRKIMCWLDGRIVRVPLKRSVVQENVPGRLLSLWSASSLKSTGCPFNPLPMFKGNGGPLPGLPLWCALRHSHITATKSLWPSSAEAGEKTRELIG